MYWFALSVVFITIACKVRSNLKLKHATTQTDEIGEVILREMLDRLMITEQSESMSICADSEDGIEMEIDYNYIKNNE
jgi:hypothetical protein